MTQFWKYIAITRTGLEVTGSLEGSLNDAERQLNAWQMHVIEIVFDIRGFLGSSWKPRRLSSASLAIFFEDLSNMYTTGMSIKQIVVAMRQSTRDRDLHFLLTVLESSLAQGSSMAEAMAKMGQLEWIVALTLHASEKAGTIEQAFAMLSIYFKRKQEMKHQLSSALVYPGVVFCALFGVMIFVGLKVVPQLKPLLPPDAFGQGATMGVLGLSSFIRQWWLLIITMPFLIGFGLFSFFRSNKNVFEEFVYQLPLIGQVYKEYHLAFYFHNLTILLKSGLPILQALKDLNTLKSSVVSRHFLNCCEYMYGGMSFWESIQRDLFFPIMVSLTIRRGEEIAHLEQYCAQLGDYFNKQVTEKLRQAVEFIQPALLLCAGGFLVLIAFAFLVPIYGNLTKIAGG